MAFKVDNYNQIDCELIADFSIKLLQDKVFPKEYAILFSESGRRLNVIEVFERNTAKLLFNTVRQTCRQTLASVSPNGGIIFGGSILVD